MSAAMAPSVSLTSRVSPNFGVFLSPYSSKISISNKWELCLNMHGRIRPRIFSLSLSSLMFISVLLKFLYYLASVNQTGKETL